MTIKSVIFICSNLCVVKGRGCHRCCLQALVTYKVPKTRTVHICSKSVPITFLLGIGPFVSLMAKCMCNLARQNLRSLLSHKSTSNLPYSKFSKNQTCACHKLMSCISLTVGLFQQRNWHLGRIS